MSQKRDTKNYFGVKREAHVSLTTLTIVAVLCPPIAFLRLLYLVFFLSVSHSITSNFIQYTFGNSPSVKPTTPKACLGIFILWMILKVSEICQAALRFPLQEPRILYSSISQLCNNVNSQRIISRSTYKYFVIHVSNIFICSYFFSIIWTDFSVQVLYLSL